MSLSVLIPVVSDSVSIGKAFNLFMAKFLQVITVVKKTCSLIYGTLIQSI